MGCLRSENFILCLFFCVAPILHGNDKTPKNECVFELVSLAKKAVKLTAKAAYISTKVVAYPAVAPLDFSVRSIYHIVKNGRKGLGRKLATRMLRDIPYVSLFLILSSLGYATHISMTEFDIETAAKVSHAPPGPTVLIDALPPEDPLTQVRLVEERARLYANTKVRQASTLKKFLKELTTLSQEMGPMGVLEVNDHGGPGITAQLFSVDELNRGAKEVAEKGTFSLDGETFDPRGLFRKGAVVKFVSCRLGAGTEGLEFNEAFHTLFLVPNGGGETIMSRVPIVVWTGIDCQISESSCVPPRSDLAQITNIFYRPWAGIDRLKDMNDSPIVFGIPGITNRIFYSSSSSQFLDLRKQLWALEVEQISPQFAQLFEKEHRRLKLDLLEGTISSNEFKIFQEELEGLHKSHTLRLYKLLQRRELRSVRP